MVVSHQEFAGTINPRTVVVGGSGSDNQPIEHEPLKLPINPGDGRTFPWLTGIAARFEKYRFRKLKFHYLPTCSTLESGGVALCPIYDPADPVPTDRITLLNAEGVVRGAVHNELVLTIPQSRMRHSDTLFVRETHEGLADANELRLSDLGFVAISLSDTQNQVNFGDVFIEYEVELSSPRVGKRNGKCAHFRRDGHSVTPSVVPCQGAPFGLGLDPDDRQYHSDSSTLMFDVDSDFGRYIRTASGSAIDTNTITFQEPFTGLMCYNHATAGAPVGGGAGGLVVNGKTVGGTDAWDLANLKDHKSTWGIVDGLRSIADAAGTAQELWKVAVNAGEALDISWLTQGAEVLDYAEIIFTDAAPALLALL